MLTLAYRVKSLPEIALDALWSLSLLLSLYDLHSKEYDRSTWAHGNLIELYLLSLIMPLNNERPAPQEAHQRALELTDALIDIAGRDSFEVYSTRRQIFRYIQWFGEISTLGPLIGLAEEIFNKFPAEVEEKWK